MEKKVSKIADYISDKFGYRAYIESLAKEIYSSDKSLSLNEIYEFLDTFDSHEELASSAFNWRESIYGVAFWSQTHRQEAKNV